MGKIAEIGRIAPERATRIIDATGKVVTPGFIDVHGHLEGNIEESPSGKLSANGGYIGHYG